MILTALALQKSVAQVKIGQHPKTPEPAAILELESPEKGLLLTRLSDTLLINQLNPPDGMLIYYTGNGQQRLMIRKQHQWSMLLTTDSLAAYFDKAAKNITAYSPFIQISNGTGAVLQPVSFQTDSTVIGHWLNAGAVNDSLATAFSRKVVKDSLISLMSSMDRNAPVNGLSRSGDKVVLGGELIEPTILNTSAVNTLSLKGLAEGSGKDSILVSENNTGIIKKNAASSLIIKVAKIKYKAKEGQVRFFTPKPVTDLERITVFRNGILIGFSGVDENTIELEQGINCNMNDEIQIIQYYY